MRLFALTAFLLVSAVPALACDVGGPFPWKDKKLYCSDDAAALIQRIGLCSTFAREIPTDAARKQFLFDTIKKNRCGRIACEYYASAKQDRPALAAYVKKQYGSARAFRESYSYSKAGCKAMKKEEE